MGTPQRPRRRVAGLLAALLVVAALAAACRPAPGAHPPPMGPSAPPDTVTATIFQRTNADRAAKALAPLAWDPRLAGLADEWARYLAEERVFAHRDLGQTLRHPGFEGYRALGENILVSPWAVDGGQMQDAWLRSPAHAANIYGPFDGFGVAIATQPNGVVKAVANFGRRAG